MPAPDPVEHSQPMFKTDLDALSTFANEKSKLPGKPYAFNASGGWKTELNRLRQNLFAPVSTSPNIGPRLKTDYQACRYGHWLRSEQPRLLRSSGGVFVSENGVNYGAFGNSYDPLLTGKHETTGQNFYFYFVDGVVISTFAVQTRIDGGSFVNAFGQSSRNLEYIFSEPLTVGTRNVTSYYYLDNTLWVDGCDANDGTFSLVNQPELRWTLDVNFPVNTTCSGDVRISQIKTAVGVVPSISVIGEFGPNATLTISQLTATTWTGFLRWANVEWNTRPKFNIGLKINNHQASGASECHFDETASFGSGTDRFLNGSGNTGELAFIQWKVTTTAQAYSGAIDGLKQCYRVSIPNCSVRHSIDSVDVDVDWDNQRRRKLPSGHYYSRGNLARIFHVPSGDISDGIWMGKTFPIRSVDMNPLKPSSSTDFALNPLARFGAPTTSTAEINKLTPAINFLIPAYPVRRESEPGEEQGQQYIGRGTIIFKVNISRAPELNGEVYDYPINYTEIIQLGYMRNNTFIELEKVKLETFSTEIYPNWVLMGAGNMLVYQTKSGKNMLVQANIFANTQANTYVIGQFFATDRYLKLPLVADHYNDTLEALNNLA